MSNFKCLHETGDNEVWVNFDHVVKFELADNGTRLYFDVPFSINGQYGMQHMTVVEHPADFLD